MHYLRVEQQPELLQAAEAIRQDSFDRGDLVPLDHLLELSRQNYGQYCAIMEEKTVVGMFYTCSYEKVTYLLYLAVRPDLRSKGIGAAFLQKWIGEAPKPAILDTESELQKKAKDYGIRVRRKHFYLRNGFYDTTHVLQDDGGYYDILCTDGKAYVTEFMDAMERLGYGVYHPVMLDTPPKLKE